MKAREYCYLRMIVYEMMSHTTSLGKEVYLLFIFRFSNILGFDVCVSDCVLETGSRIIF